MPQVSDRNPAGIPFIELQSVDSTNNYARSLLHASGLTASQGFMQHGTAIFAHEQVAGKGQRGRSWNSEKGANIMLSILLDPQPLSIAQQFRLSACIAVAVHDFFMKYGGDTTRIKWPNDIYWQDRKAGGILIESGISGSPANWDWAIAGIGLNINQTVFPEGLTNPVSLKQLTGKGFDTVVLAKELCTYVQQYLEILENDGFETIYKRYNQYLYKRSEKVKLKQGNRVFEAIIKGVSREGRLLTQHVFDEDFDFGAVSWILGE